MNAPPKLTHEFIEDMATLVEKAIPPTTAAILAGMANTRSWQSAWTLGQHLYETGAADDLDEHEQLCYDLAFRIDVALARCEEWLLQTHLTALATSRRNAATGSMWLLERRFPERWGKTITRSHAEERRERLEDILDRVDDEQ